MNIIKKIKSLLFGKQEETYPLLGMENHTGERKPPKVERSAKQRLHDAYVVKIRKKRRIRNRIAKFSRRSNRGG